MDAAERRALNRQLLAQGERICNICGRRLPLANFRRSWNKRVQRSYYASRCSRCADIIAAERWHNDPAYRQQHKAYTNAYAKRHRDALRSRCRDAQRRRRARQLAAHVRRLLSKEVE